jgi:uncharacterized membrane protein
MLTTLITLATTDPTTMAGRLMGRMHPAIVHFPIALVTVAAVLEAWQIVRRKDTINPATPVCLVLGALSAIVASTFGWLWDSYEPGGKNVDLHQWIGIGATAAAVFAVILLIKAAQSSPARMALRGFVFASAAAVGLTGYLGGDLVHGKNHLLKGLFDEAKPEGPALAMANTGNPPDIQLVSDKTAHGDKVDFVRDVVPIFKDTCLKCHGGDKVKGKLDMKTKAGVVMFKAASGEVTVTPGQPDKSSLYTLLMHNDPEERMPPAKEKQLTKDQIDIVRKWIAQGAAWPDGVEVR